MRVVGIILFLITIGFVAFVVSGVPLLPEENDSAWYYMNVHYLLTGEYLYEEIFPSFAGPCQYYPSGGYSLILLLAKAIEPILGTSWVNVLSVIQLGTYALSAWLLFAIGRLFNYPKAAIASVALFFLYFPFVYFTTVAMSESLAVVLMLTVLWLTIRGLLRKSTTCLLGAFLVLGYGVLVKPVFMIAFPVFFVVVLAYQWKEKHLKTWAVVILLFLLCPVAQSLSNGSTMGSYRMRSGLGWHLWNRIIYEDNSFPKHAKLALRLSRKLRSRGEPGIRTGWWWEFVAQLSRHGYSRQETEAICRELAMQGLRENKWKYAKNTFARSWALLTQNLALTHLYETHDQYFAYLTYFGQDRQRAPLVSELWSQREVFSGENRNVRLSIYHTIARAFSHVQQVRFEMVIAFGYMLWSCLIVARILRDRSFERLPAFLVIVVPALVVVGSCLAESPSVRHRLPAMPLIILGCCAVVEDGIRGARGAFRRQGIGSATKER